MLDFHEIANIHQYSECEKNGQSPVSVGNLMLVITSHFLLVFNSGMNIVIYCVMSQKFREECINSWAALMSRRRSTEESTATTVLVPPNITVTTCL